VRPIADAVEARDAIVASCHRLAVDDAGARTQPGEALDDEREALGEVVARPTVEPHAVAVLAGDHAQNVVLDFVQATGRRKAGAGLRWEGTKGG
jgi:hypothetical protein